MKRIMIMVVVFAILATFSFAEGAKESVPKEITVLTGREADDPALVHAIENLEADYPGVDVIVSKIDLSDGSTLTMTAMKAAGTPPNVYDDYIGRVSENLVPEYALDLTGYVRDLDQYDQSMLDQFTRDGQVLGLPGPVGVQGMAVNLDIMDEIGFTVKFDWTINDFLYMAELVKQKYGGEKYATGLFAGNQSGDYLVNNWFAAFGAKFYEPGDYSRTVIESTGGAEVYEFFQDMIERGYVRDDSATLVDDDYVIQWATGEIAAGAFFPSWTEYYFKTVIEQGKLDKPFNYAFVPFPRAPGVDKVQTYASFSAIVVHKTGTEQDRWAARFAEYLNDAYSQSQASLKGVIPTRRDAVSLSDDIHIQETANIASRNGIMDVGLTMPKYSAVRPQHFPVLQKVLNMSVTPEEAIAEYAERINEQLK